MAEKDLKSLRFKNSEDVYKVYDETARQAVDALEDVVEGKQSKIDAQHKLSVDLVDGALKSSDLEGLASEQYVDGAIETVEGQIPDVSELATKSEVEAVEQQIPSIEGLATEEYVDNAIDAIDIPEGLDTLTEDVATLKDEMATLTEDSYEEIDLVAVATKVTGKYINAEGAVSNSDVWSYYSVSKPENCNFVHYKCYQGAQVALPMVAFYRATTISSANYISGDNAGGTITNNYIENTVEIPEGTKLIVFSTKYAEGGEPTGIGTVGVRGTIPSMQIELDALQEAIEHIGGKKVKDGLKIAIVGDSISTSTKNRMPEIKVQSEDVGHQLGAWLTYHDVTASAPLTLGGKTYTTDDIGKYIIFTPTSEDVGKTIGNEKMYNGTGTKVWWEYLKEDLGADTLNATWCSASLSSHEKTSTALQTSYGWHDSQIRRCGKRIAGTMRREAPDVVIVYRGTNDMTHSPFVKLTNNYFTGINWTYPTNDTLSDGNYGYKEAISMFVKKIHKVYPRAKIVLATLNNFKRVNYSKFPVHNGTNTLQDFNKAIREAAEYFGLQTVDFDKDGITFENMYPYYISDSASTPTHPNNNGHKAMGIQAINDLTAKLGLLDMEPQNLEGLVNYQAVADLTNATKSGASSAYTGETFTCTLTGNYGYIVDSVTVKMGGVVVANAWNSATGVITVENVNGDIEITNTAKEAVMYNITQNLTNLTSDFTQEHIAEGASMITLTANAGYTMGNITVTVGGVDVTNSVYQRYPDKGVITFTDLDNDVVITASGTIVGDGTSYTVLSGLKGASGKNVNPNVPLANIKHVYTKIRSGGVSGGGFGAFGDIFCIGYTGIFGTGGSALTNVAQEAGKEFLIALKNVNANASQLKIYDGADEQRANLLGQTSRSSSSGTENGFFYLGLGPTKGGGYEATADDFLWSDMIGTDNNISHSYIPVKRNSDNVTGLYDIIGNAFYALA